MLAVRGPPADWHLSLLPAVVRLWQHGCHRMRTWPLLQHSCRFGSSPHTGPRCTSERRSGWRSASAPLRCPCSPRPSALGARLAETADHRRRSLAHARSAPLCADQIDATVKRRMISRPNLLTAGETSCRYALSNESKIWGGSGSGPPLSSTQRYVRRTAHGAALGAQKMSGNWCVRLTISAYMPMSIRAHGERVSRVRGMPVGSRGLGANGQAMARTKIVAHVHGGHLHDLAALQLANDLIVALAHRLRRVLVGAVGADDGRQGPCTGDGRGVMRGGRGDEGG